ncbi:MAG TPA: hypothetical protein VI282_04955, partial [Verrucomicrobiae bacterium]
MTVRVFLFCLTLFLLRSQARADFQGSTHMMPFDEDTISYSKTEASGPVSRLVKSIADGKTALKFDAKYGYLPSVLEALGISFESQVLVFSKTSFQRERIEPETPRALFYNDGAYIGYIPGSPMLEFSEVDPKLGAVFYTLDQTKAERPKIVRNDQCLECHASAKSMGVPGQLLRSFEVDASGVVDLQTGTSQVDDRTPFNERWGGWYVTGTHGTMTHRGNLFGAKAFKQAAKEPNYLGNVTDLSQFIDVAKYPRNQSDIVSLMALEHETHMHNFITRLDYETEIALQQYGKIDHLKSKVDSFLQYALFTEEAPITNAVKGSPAFVKEFESRGPFDSKGRSLRQFDLNTRLFKYPCSFLIYSEQFDAMPAQIKEMIYKRLYEILTGADKSAKFQTLTANDRKAILEILRETKMDLPDYWRAS